MQPSMSMAWGCGMSQSPGEQEAPAPGPPLLHLRPWRGPRDLPRAPSVRSQETRAWLLQYNPVPDEIALKVRGDWSFI